MIDVPGISKWLLIIAISGLYSGCALIDPPEDIPPRQDLLDNIIITEIHYNPLPQDTVLEDQDDFEFIEIFNKGSAVVSMKNVVIDDGIDYRFNDNAVINPGEYLVLASNKEKFKSRYKFDPYDQYSGHLKNSGERLALTDNETQRKFFMVEYSDQGQWPWIADGEGYSLVLKSTDKSSILSAPSQWRASLRIHGSPGTADPLPVYVNEVMPHTDPPYEDAIELYNPNSIPVDIGGWFLTDDRTIPFKFRIPDGTIIAADGYLVFYSSHFNDSTKSSRPFNLSENGEDAYLFADTADLLLRGCSHGFSFNAVDNAITIGRFINSAGDECVAVLDSPTLGSANTRPVLSKQIVITEIMYNPTAGGYEYVEIKNISDQPVPLFDPSYRVNTWKIKGFDFTFPDSTLQSGEVAVVTSYDVTAETFRTVYSVPQNVKIFNTALGGLRNSSDTISLLMPLKPNTDNPMDIPYMAVETVAYHDGKLWPASADGGGYALVRKKTDEFINDPNNWTAALPSPGIHNNP